MTKASKPLNQHERLVNARAKLVLDHIFWGALALPLNLQPDTTSPIGWTDGQTIGFNPEGLAGFTGGQLQTFLAHEAGGHVGLAHHTRRGNREPRLWNEACDHAVNAWLAASGFEPVPGWLLDHRFDGMAAEEIYAVLLRERQPQQGQPQSGQGQPQPGQGDPDQGQGQGDGDGDDPGQQGQPQPGQGQGQDNPDPGGCGEVRDAPAPDGGQATPADLAQAAAEARVRVAQAALAAKLCGQLPAGLARMVEGLLEPRVDWRSVLWQFVDQTSRDDYCWQRPSRRYLSQGLYLPSLYSEEMRPIVVAVDTSGSISGPELDQFTTELSAILAQSQASATVMYVDSEVAGVEEWTPDDLPLTLSPKGGGGTDFRPPFHEVERRGDSPSCLIYLTDGECSSFPEPPDYPVLWAVFGRQARRFNPPFGWVIPILPD